MLVRRRGAGLLNAAKWIQQNGDPDQTVVIATEPNPFAAHCRAGARTWEA